MVRLVVLFSLAGCVGGDEELDLDGDGLPDLVTVNYLDAEGYSPGSAVYYGASGFSDAAAAGIEASGWTGLASDLNGDAAVDLVVVNHYSGSRATLSSVYWGSETGISDASRTDLPTTGPVGALAADLNGDAYQEIVFANNRSDSSTEVDSSVYWGSADGYSADARTDLPTAGAWDVESEDLNGDGWSDLVFCNFASDSTYDTDSFVYWGSVDGFSTEVRTDLPTAGCRDVEVADLDCDGLSEIVFANSYDDTEGERTASFVYWGSVDGYAADHRTELPTTAAVTAVVDDLDGDGDEDLAFSSWYTPESWSTAVSVYWQEDGVFSAATTLAADGAYGLLAEDLDADGYPELIVPSYANDLSWTTSSTVWWGSPEGYAEDRKTVLETISACAVSVGDLDGDGWLDLLFSSLYADDGVSTAVRVFWGSEAGYSDGDRTELDAGAGSFSAPLVVGG